MAFSMTSTVSSSMCDHHVAGGIFASALSFILLWALFSRRGKCGGGSSVAAAERNGGASELIPSGDGGADVIIVGAGVAGAALAHTLGKDGRRVHVIERDLTEPNRMVGELLQPGGYLKLIELGLQDCVENIDSQRMFGYSVFKDGRRVTLSYPLEKFHVDVSGRSFHNGRFIRRLRGKAASLPNVRLEQGTVTSLVEEKGVVKGVQYKNKIGEQVKAYAPLTIVCDGCFSNMRRSLYNPKIEVPSHMVGLTMEGCSLATPEYAYVVLGYPSLLVFYPISSTQVRCLVDVPGQKLPCISNGDLANYLKTVVAPQIPPETYEAFIAAVDKGDMKTMPIKSMPSTPLAKPGAFLIGDSSNMRHPLTGGGMTVALSDIVLLRDLLRPLKDFTHASALCTYLQTFYILRKPVASTINALSTALYRVLCASSDQVGHEMRRAWLDYVALGRLFTRGPMGLVSGLSPSPTSLVLHYFAVAIFGFTRLLLPFPSPKRLYIAIMLFYKAVAIIFPIMEEEGIRETFFPATLLAYYTTPPV